MWRAFPALWRVRRELRQRNVSVAAIIALHVIYEPAKAHECLFHFLMSVEPLLFPGADIGNLAVGEFFSRVVKAQILTPRSGCSG